MPIELIELGAQYIGNPMEGEPAYLSAASGVAWAGNTLYSVGDDQATLARFELGGHDVQNAFHVGEHCNLLKPGFAQRIIPGKLPLDPSQRSEAKPDFEALTMITRQHLDMLPDGEMKLLAITSFPHGLLLITGSGGVSWGGIRRSIGVVYALDQSGSVLGLPAQVSFEGLHAFLDEHYTLPGDLNIEGTCVHGGELILAQRGNSIDERSGQPAENMLIRLSLLEVMRSICFDLQVDRMDLLGITSYNDLLGSLPATHNGVVHEVKLDFTDLDSVVGDPGGHLIFTAAAEGVDGPFKGKIAGSAIGLIEVSTGKVVYLDALANPSIKLEGINAWYNAYTNRIEFLVVDDADDPSKVAMVRAGSIG